MGGEEVKELMQKDYSKIEIGNAPGQKNPAILGGNKTVFHELKLSEILLADIDVYREEINNQKELT